MKVGHCVRRERRYLWLVCVAAAAAAEETVPSEREFPMRTETDKIAQNR